MKKTPWGLPAVCLGTLGALVTAAAVCQFKQTQRYVRRARPLLEQISTFEARTGRLPADERELEPFAQRPDGPYYEQRPDGGYGVFFITGADEYLIWSSADRAWRKSPAPPAGR